MNYIRCPRCRSSLMSSKSLDGGESPFWKECTNPFCGTMVDTFKPTPMQYNFLKDNHKFKGVFGGFGSGKSFAIIEDVIKHCLITPGAYVGVIGFTFRQIRRNFIKDFNEIMPVKFMKISGNQKTPGFNASEMLYTLKNGAKIELITADMEGKVRGLNASKIVILEASNVSGKIQETAKSRLRNIAAMIPKVDEEGEIIYEEHKSTGEKIPVIESSWINMVYESNPDSGYIRTELLLKANRVQFYGESYEKYAYRLDEIDEEISMHISATNANPYLPPNYVEDNTRTMPYHEIRRFYYGSFLFGEHMVYPRFNEIVVDPYPIDFNDKNIYVIIGYDYGLANKSAFTFSAVNFRTNKIIVYDELGVVNMSVKEIAKEYRKKLSVIPEGKLLFLPKMDAKSYNKRGADLVTIGSMFEDVGLLFDPIQESHEARTMKLNSLIESHQIQVFRTCTNLIEEVTGYKWAVNNKGERTGKREDKNNHFIDSLEFATIKLPYNLEEMKIDDWIKPGHYIEADLNRPKKKIKLNRVDQLRVNLNPLNQEFNLYEETTKELNDDEIENIISKLSGI